jgi:hypothetical protein
MLLRVLQVLRLLTVGVGVGVGLSVLVCHCSVVIRAHFWHELRLLALTPNGTVRVATVAVVRRALVLDGSAGRLCWSRHRSVVHLSAGDAALRLAMPG